MNPHDILSLFTAKLKNIDDIRASRILETHTAFVFLVGNRAYKTKKPVKLPYLDFSTPEKRRAALQTELRINQKWTNDVYLRLLTISSRPDQTLILNGTGDPIEWVLEMKRLPESDLLANRLAHGQVLPKEVERLGNRLCEIYKNADRKTGAADIYLEHLRHETLVNREHLLSMRAHLKPYLSHSSLQYAADLIERHEREIIGRGMANLIVDGHGDLRLDHICLTNPPAIFDRIEFDADMRQIDIYDEINCLAMETELAGQRWIGQKLMASIDHQFQALPSPGLMQTYALFRLFLHARLAIDHLLEPFPRTPGKWVKQAVRYLVKAGELAAVPSEA